MPGGNPSADGCAEAHSLTKPPGAPCSVPPAETTHSNRGRSACSDPDSRTGHIASAKQITTKHAATSRIIVLPPIMPADTSLTSLSPNRTRFAMPPREKSPPRGSASGRKIQGSMRKIQGNFKMTLPPVWCNVMPDVPWNPHVPIIYKPRVPTRLSCRSQSRSETWFGISDNSWRGCSC